MNHNEFIRKYYEVAKRALACNEKARREGLLALEDELDDEKINSRDIFEYGIRFVIDGTDALIIEEVLSNIIKQEQDENMQRIKTIQKTAVRKIQEGINPRILCALLNSYTDIPLSEDEILKSVDL
jgi:flagellar motor component MotA